MKKKIAIIGSGIAGLTLANFLYQNKNHDFIIYEKSDSLPLDEGYGIQLSTNSIKILNKLNFSKVNSEKIYHPKDLDIYNIQNKKLCDLDLVKFNCFFTIEQIFELVFSIKDKQGSFFLSCFFSSSYETACSIGNFPVVFFIP